MIETSRLILRRWRESDIAPYAALNADPEVREFFPGLLSAEQSADQIALMQDRWDLDGVCFAAVERKSDGFFLGMAGLSLVSFECPCKGAFEVGWRLARDFWGQGYASEAARAWLDYGFETLGREEIVAFTVPDNLRSIAVMRRLGMGPDPARDFDHPNLEEGHPLRRHVVYALRRR